MKKSTLILAISAFLLLNFSSVQLYGQDKSNATYEGSIVQLFNGQNLDGWYTFLKDRGRNNDPKKVFTVNNGLIRISGEEWGCITSKKEYKNYHLTVEFKWGEKTFGSRVDKARDSGVLLHSNGNDGAFGDTWMNSIECQLIEGGTGDFIVVGNGTNSFSITSPVAPQLQGNSNVFQMVGNPKTITGGRIDWYDRDPNWQDVKGFRGANDVENPIGEWNKLECIVNQDKITVYLNGKLVNKAFDVKPSKGRIQIQSEGAELFVKKVELTPLTKNYRLMYDSDGGNLFIYKKPPMTPEMLYPYIDEVAETGVTSFFMSPHYGMPMIFPTKVARMIGEDVNPEFESKISLDAKPKTIERGVANLRSLIKAGHDPFGLVVDRAHQNGMEAFVSFRLNEVHWVEKEDALILSHFWKEHPEWRIGKNGDPLSQVYLDILGPRTSPVVAGWLPGGLNFAIPEVRAHRLAQMREMCERFDIDGLDLDFQRFPMYFKIGEEIKYTETMTNWIREIREMTNEVGVKRGRPILLCARIMAKPGQNTAIGLDPVTWANENLLDFVIVSHYLHNNFSLPIREYKKLFPKGYPIYGSIEVEKKEEDFRNIAQQLWQDKVDGISLFNFFTSRERGVEPLFNIIPEIGSPQILSRISTPMIIGGGSIFHKPNKALIRMESSPETNIYYTVDGNEPTLNSIKYTAPIELSEITYLKARAFKKDFPFTSSKISQQKVSFVDPEVHGLKYTVYEGTWKERPDLNKIKPVSTGKTFEFDVNKIKRRGDYVAIKFEGYVEIVREGEYTFYSSANDGSLVSVDGEIVVDNTGHIGPKTDKGKVFLSKGKHKFEVFYYENTGTESLNFELEGPGIKKQPFPLESIFFEK